MVGGPRYHVMFRRRRMNITDYQMRKTMISSKRTRVTVRFSGKYIYLQIITALPIGDKVLTAVCSKELEKFGWVASHQNTSAAYLSGLLLGKKASALSIDAAILDIGLRQPSKGARVFAVAKGMVDAGIQVPYDKRVLPREERIRGEHIASYAKILSEEDQQHYERLFSQYLSRGLKPEELVGHFNNVKNNILTAS